MTTKESIKILNEVIPPPGNKMVDMEHSRIAVAWETIKEALPRPMERREGRLTSRNALGSAFFPQCFKDPCSGMGCRNDQCGFLIEVCEALATYEDRDEKGCFWCKEQVDDFGDTRMTASEIKVVSRDITGTRELPRNFCPVCGRQIGRKEETEK